MRYWSQVLLTPLFASSCAAFATAPPPVEPVPAARIAPPDLLYLDRSLGNDAIVRITTPHVACTGTLIAEDRVLTAHHCLARRDGDERYLAQTVDADDVRVELGGDYLPWGEIGVRAIVTPPCGHGSGVGDIAILVLGTRLKHVSTLPISEEPGPNLGEEVWPIGFGTCADSGDGIRRKSRAGAEITFVLGSRFQSLSAICPGDSGGPALNQQGAVLGVISRSAMDGQEATASRTEFTRVDRWQDVFANAQRISDGESPAEQPPIAGCESSDLPDTTLNRGH